MSRIITVAGCVAVVVLAAGAAYAQTDSELIADAVSAGPPAVTANATIKAGDGRVLREGSNGWTCYPGSSALGPMCNRAQWDAALGAFMKREPIDIEEFSISYMLAGEGEALGVSNIDPFATRTRGSVPHCSRPGSRRASAADPAHSRRTPGPEILVVSYRSGALRRGVREARAAPS